MEEIYFPDFSLFLFVFIRNLTLRWRTKMDNNCKYQVVQKTEVRVGMVQLYGTQIQTEDPTSICIVTTKCRVLFRIHYVDQLLNPSNESRK